MSNLLYSIGGVIISNLPGAIVGGIIGWLLSWWTSAPRHRRMGESLQRLHDDDNLLLRALHNKGVINIQWGPDGKPLGDMTDVLAGVILQIGGGSVHEFKPKPQGGNRYREEGNDGQDNTEDNHQGAGAGDTGLA